MIKALTFKSEKLCAFFTHIFRNCHFSASFNLSKAFLKL